MSGRIFFRDRWYGFDDFRRARSAEPLHMPRQSETMILHKDFAP
jgi:hypothetical protein